MNSSTSSENVFINSFSYLNQTSQAVISGNSTFANVINFPYRLGLSFIGAVNLQYEQTVKSEEIPPTLRSVFDTIGFFFQPVRHILLCNRHCPEPVRCILRRP